MSSPIASISRPPGRAAAVVHLRGELDVHTAAQAEPLLLELAEDGVRDLVIDLSAVTFCDSSGAGLFLRLDRLRDRSTGLRLRGVTRQPARVFRLLGLHRAVPCAFAPDLASLPACA